MNPTQNDDRVSFEGPFQEWRVVVDGKEVPHLNAQMADGGKVALTCDHAISIVLPVGLAEEVADFVSFAMQVALRGARWTPVHDISAVQMDEPDDSGEANPS